jgi:acetylornithine deacetylase/succinyl-diaminopimelate desuccinylase-like protein
LASALDDAAGAAFAGQTKFMGEGGTIPFMGMLGEQFPAAQFVVTGVLGPGANAHGPNEFLHVPTAMRVTEVVARVLAAHAGASSI